VARVFRAIGDCITKDWGPRGRECACCNSEETQHFGLQKKKTVGASENKKKDKKTKEVSGAARGQKFDGGGRIKGRSRDGLANHR